MPTKNTTSPPRQEFPVGQDYVPLTEVPTLGRALIDGNVSEVGYINSFLHHLAANTHADDKEMEDLDDNRRRKRKGRRWRDNYPKVKRTSKKHKKKSKQTPTSRSGSFSFHPANAAATIAELDRYLKRRASDTGIDYPDIEHLQPEPEPERAAAGAEEGPENDCLEESRFAHFDSHTFPSELEEPVDPMAYANYRAAIAAASAASTYVHSMPSTSMAYPHVPGWSLVGVPTTPHPVSPQQQALAQQCGVINVPEQQHVVMHPTYPELYHPQLTQPVPRPLPQMAQPIVSHTYTQPIQPTMGRHKIGLVEQRPLEQPHYIPQPTGDEQLDQFLAAHDDILDLQAITQPELALPTATGLELPCEPSTQAAVPPPPVASVDADFLEELFAWEGISCM